MSQLSLFYSNTGEHRHCFCNTDAGGTIICCHCGQPLEILYAEPEVVLMRERMGHEKDLIEEEEG